MAISDIPTGIPEKRKSKECSKSDEVVVIRVDGEPDHEFPHIVRINSKIHCNECGNWDWLVHWQDFMKVHCK